MESTGMLSGFRRFLSPPGTADLYEGVRVRALQAAMVAVPLAVAPGLLASVVDLPKRIALEAFVAVAWAALFLPWAAAGAVRLRRSPLDWPALGLVAAASVSAILAVNPAVSLGEAGLLLALASLGGAVATGLAPSGLARLLSAILGTGGAVAVYGILQYCGIDFLPWASSWGSRCFGTIGNPVFFAEFLAPVFVLAVALLVAEEDEERKDLLGLLVLAVFLALLFSQTRSAWLGCLAGVSVAGWGMWFRAPGGRDAIRRNRVWLASAFAFAVVVSLTISSPKLFGKAALPLKARLSDMVDFKGWTVRHRLALWRAGAVMLRESPLLGVGPMQFRVHFPDAQAKFRASLAAKSFYFAPKESRAHSDYVQAAAEGGVVGLGILLWVFVALVGMGVSAVRRAAGPADGARAAGMLGGCVALMVDALFNFPFAVIPAAAVFCAFAGGLAVLHRGDPEWRVLPLPFRGRSAAVAGWSVSAAVFVIVAWSVIPSVRADRASAIAATEFDSGKWEMAQTFLEGALKRAPHDGMVHYQMARALDKGSSYDWSGKTLDRALYYYLEAERLGIRDELLYSQLALLYERKGQVSRAIRSVERAVVIFPERADYLSNLAYWLSVRNQRLKDALEYSRKSVELVPEHPLYRWTRGLVLEKAGRKREALAQLKIALQNLDMVPGGRFAYEGDLRKDIARVSR